MQTKVIASLKTRIEDDAVVQLKKTAQLPGMEEAVGMPDLHPGKDSPIGAVFRSKGVIYPHLVGSDKGCGMALWKTALRDGKLKLDRWERKLEALAGPWDGDASAFLAEHGVSPTAFDASLGTVGRGNHFAELQRVFEVVDAEKFAQLELDTKSLYILVHSGSRGFGESILHAHTAEFANGGLRCDSPEGQAYLAAHDHAVLWARINRKLIAHRYIEALGTQGTCVLDVCHNNVQASIVDGCKCWLHRKGAAPSDVGPVVIPGSRDSLSYLVAAHGDQRGNLASLAHGAGRKWQRSKCRGLLEDRFTNEQLRRNRYGGRVVCDDKNLLYEEAGQAYKNIDQVVQDLVDAGLIRTIAKFAPVLTYKISKRERDDE